MKMKEEEKEANGSTKIHNVRFYNLTPRSINCLAYNESLKKLAISRSGTIEIWDMKYAPLHEKTIVVEDDAYIEGIAWSGQRFFTVGLAGQLIEWDLITMAKRQSQHATGNSIWCLDVSRDGTQLAVGTEEGYINIFDISEGQMAYTKLFDKQEGRILCCKFDATGEHLVTGGIGGAIRIWDVKTGHAINKMTLSRKEVKKDVIVWSIQVLRDFTILSGDSRGVVTVWDGKKAAHIEEHHVLQADVLAVAMSEDEKTFICSGIDPIIRMYALTEIRREDVTLRKWVKYRQRNVHDHDVKALICMDDKIVSGGVDGYLGISSIKSSVSQIMKYGPFLEGSCATVAVEKKLLLLRYPNTVEIWRLGETTGQLEVVDEEPPQEGEAGEEVKLDESKKLLALQKAPKKLLEMKSKDGQTITCSTLSPDGNWLAYSTNKDIRLFSFTAGREGEVSQLSRIKVLPEQFSACRHILFTNDSSTLFLVKVDNSVDVFTILSNGDIDYSHTILAGKYIKDIIHLIDVSNCGNYFVTAGTCRTIAVWAKKDNHYMHHLNLPRYTAPTTAVAMHHDFPRLVATFSDSKIFEYDLEEMCFTCTDYFSWDAKTLCVNNIVLDRRNPNVFILHNDTRLFVLQKCSPLKDNPDSAKKSKRTVDTKVAGLKLKFSKIYKHFIELTWLSPVELVAVGVNPISLIEQLPGAFKQKKFGAG